MFEPLNKLFMYVQWTKDKYAWEKSLNLLHIQNFLMWIYLKLSKIYEIIAENKKFRKRAKMSVFHIYKLLKMIVFT